MNATPCTVHVIGQYHTILQKFICKTCGKQLTDDDVAAAIANRDRMKLAQDPKYAEKLAKERAATKREADRITAAANKANEEAKRIEEQLAKDAQAAADKAAAEAKAKADALAKQTKK